MGNDQEYKCSKCGRAYLTIAKATGELTATLHRPFLILSKNDEKQEYEFACPDCENEDVLTLPPDLKNAIEDTPPKDYLRWFSHARSIRPLDKFSDGITVPQIARCADGFTANIKRVISLCELTAIAAGILAINANSAEQIAKTFFSRRQDRKAILDTFREASKLRKETIAPLSAESRKRILAAGFDSLTNFSAAHPEIGPSMDAIFGAQTTGAWTAFEVLATDMWIEAVNLRPKSLGVNALLAPRKNKSVDDTTEDDKKRPNPISLDLLIQYDFDLKSRLGKMLWSKSYLSFNSLEGLASTYRETFCVRDKKGNKHRPEKTKNWFHGDRYDDLESLEASRHALVHRAGIADENFKDRMKSNKHFSSVEIGDVVPLDGRIVRRHLDAVIVRAKILIEGVSQWLETPET